MVPPQPRGTHVDDLVDLETGVCRVTRILPFLSDRIELVEDIAEEAIGAEHPCFEEALLLAGEAVANLLPPVIEDGTDSAGTVRVMCTPTWVRIELHHASALIPDEVRRDPVAAGLQHGRAIAQDVHLDWGFSCRVDDGVTIWFELEPED